MQNGEKPIVSFELPSGPEIDEAIIIRRKQYKGFAEIREDLRNLIVECANRKLSNEDFYDSMMEKWKPPVKLQGRGFEIRGKHGDWQDVCQSISKILAVPKTALDDIVKKEIDRLAKAKNPNRGAWMSEMLCLYFPDLYYVVAKPVSIWLKHNNYQPARNESQGSRYISLALRLRQAINQNKRNKINEAQNLLELDHAIWKWYDLENS